MHQPLRASPLVLQCPLLKCRKELVRSCNKEFLASSCSSLLVKGWWPHHWAVVLHFEASKTILMTATRLRSPGQEPVCSVHPRDSFPSRGYLSTQHLYVTLVMSYERNSGTETFDLPEETYGKRELKPYLQIPTLIILNHSLFFPSNQYSNVTGHDFALSIHLSFTSQPPPW